MRVWAPLYKVRVLCEVDLGSIQTGNFYPLSNWKMSQAKYTAVDLVSYSPRHHGYGKQLVIRIATSL